MASRKDPKKDDRDLDAYGAMLDRMAGEPVGTIAGHIRAYRRAMDAKAAFKGHPTKARIDAVFAGAVRSGVNRHDNRKVIAVRTATKTQRRIRSSVVQEKAPKVYELSRVPQLTLGMKSPDTPEVYVPEMRGGTLMSAMRAYEEFAAEQRKHKTAEETSRDALKRILPTLAWDGSAVLLADGWRLSWSESRVFSGTEFRKLCDRYGQRPEDFMTDVVVEGSVHYRLVAASAGNEGDEYAP